MAQSCVQTPITVEKPNSSRLHPSGRYGNTSECTSVFETIPYLLCRHGLGRLLAPVHTLCIHSDDMATPSRCGPVMVITCKQSATFQTLGQHCSDASLIWKCVKRVMESRLHRRPSRCSIFPSGCRLEKSNIDSF
jgi:hypothetical protein